MKQNRTETPTQKELSEMSDRIALLKKRAEQSKTDAKDSLHTQVRALEDQYELVTAKLNKASKQAGVVSNEIQGGVSKAWIELKNSFENASRQIH